MERIGQPASFLVDINTVGDIESLADGYFVATLTNVTEMTLTSVATGTVSQTIDGYILQCLGSVAGDTEISIPGKLLLQKLLSEHFKQICTLCLMYR